jgi:hypothetical protein
MSKYQPRTRVRERARDRDRGRKRDRSPDASPPSSSKRGRSTTACRFFNTRRGCRDGDKCMFSHGDGASPARVRSPPRSRVRSPPRSADDRGWGADVRVAPAADGGGWGARSPRDEETRRRSLCKRAITTLLDIIERKGGRLYANDLTQFYQAMPEAKDVVGKLSNRNLSEFCEDSNGRLTYVNGKNGHKSSFIVAGKASRPGSSPRKRSRGAADDLEKVIRTLYDIVTKHGGRMKSGPAGQRLYGKGAVMPEAKEIIDANFRSNKMHNVCKASKGRLTFESNGQDGVITASPRGMETKKPAPVADDGGGWGHGANANRTETTEVPPPPRDPRDPRTRDAEREVPSPPVAAAAAAPSDASEEEKVWLYADPDGVIQGPFKKKSFRKWVASGAMPESTIAWHRDSNASTGVPVASFLAS